MKLEGIRLMVKMFASAFFSRSMVKPDAFNASDSSLSFWLRQRGIWKVSAVTNNAVQNPLVYLAGFSRNFILPFHEVTNDFNQMIIICILTFRSCLFFCMIV